MPQETLPADIDNLINKWKDKRGNLIMILHEIQNKYGYVPRETSLKLSRALDVPLAKIYEVITFYHFFRLEPPGKHNISVCMGTACYLKGASEILNELEKLLAVEAGHTSSDGVFHLDVVRCLGCCGLAPVVKIDEKVYSKVKRESVSEIISLYRREQAAK